MADIIKPQPLSGFGDYSEAENVALSNWLDRINETFRRYGFSRLIPRPLERRDVLLSQGGIQKQIFGISRLPDDMPTDLALPFDRTVPLAHWVAMNAGQMVFPYKRFDTGYSYRGERAQAGRFQGFFQADIDIIGLEKLDLSADAECIAVAYEALGALDLGTYTVHVNHIGLAKMLLRKLGLADEKMPDALRAIDKLDKIGPDEVTKEMVATTGISADQAGTILEVFTFVGEPADFATNVEGEEMATAFEQLQTVWAALPRLGVPAERLRFRPGIVRGLNYYSGTVFETFLDGREDFGSVASGGRYDDLVSTFSKLKLPGVGASIGVTRLFDAAVRTGLLTPERRSEAEIFVGFRTADLQAAAQELAGELRAGGARVDLYSGTGAVKKQFAYAGKKGIPVLVTVMDAEAIVVRDMSTGEQEELTTAPAARDAAMKLRGSLLSS